MGGRGSGKKPLFLPGAHVSRVTVFYLSFGLSSEWYAKKESEHMHIELQAEWARPGTQPQRGHEGDHGAKKGPCTHSSSSKWLSQTCCTVIGLN